MYRYTLTIKVTTDRGETYRHEDFEADNLDIADLAGHARIEQLRHQASLGGRRNTDGPTVHFDLVDVFAHDQADFDAYLASKS
jgi:hypothetical protein